MAQHCVGIEAFHTLYRNAAVCQTLRIHVLEERYAMGNTSPRATRERLTISIDLRKFITQAPPRGGAWVNKGIYGTG